MAENNSRMDPVFLLSPGRSGSTLLQRHLNSSDDLILWGEHGGFLKEFGRAYRKWHNNDHVQYLLQSESVHASLLLSKKPAIGVDVEWTNNFTKEDFKEYLATMIRELFTIGVPENLRWGFKEVRYKGEDIYFLRGLFPASQFVFIVRDPVHTLASMIIAFAKGRDVWESEWTSETYVQAKKQLKHWSIRTGKIAKDIVTCVKNGVGYLVKYEELVDNPYEIIGKLCGYLNISLPPIELTGLIARDVRYGMDTFIVRERLKSEFLDEKCVQDLLNVYNSLGYA